jgi:hypothetical protein
MNVDRDSRSQLILTGYSNIALHLGSMQVQTDGSGIGSDWKLDSIIVEHPKTGQATTFSFQGWISRIAGLRHTLYPRAEPSAKTEQATLSYEVATFTSDIRFAGTDAEVWIAIDGDNGSLAAQKLRNNTRQNLFERGRQDVFELVGPNISRIKKVCCTSKSSHAIVEQVRHLLFLNQLQHALRRRITTLQRLICLRAKSFGCLVALCQGIPKLDVS